MRWNAKWLHGRTERLPWTFQTIYSAGMISMHKFSRLFWRLQIFCGLFLAVPLSLVYGWDYEGHRLVNRLALATLPEDFPAFVKTTEAVERIQFLGGEADRWRNTSELALKHVNHPDHYFDVDFLPDAGLTLNDLNQFRYDFVLQFDAARKAHLANFPTIDPQKDQDHTRALIGFLPWTIMEYYAKLKSGFSTLKVFQELGTPEEVRNAQQNIIYVMGTMGHFVGDGGQPLHTTKHYDGWTTPNPKNFTTNRIHSLIDGGYLEKYPLNFDILQAQLRAAQIVATEANGNPAGGKAVFAKVLEYLAKQYQQVEPLYELYDKKAFVRTRKEPGEGQEFLSRQILAAGQFLGDIWFSAWKQAHPDRFLQSALQKRKLDEKKPNP